MAEFSKQKCEEYVSRLQAIQGQLFNSATRKSPAMQQEYCYSILVILDEMKTDQPEFADAIRAYRVIFDNVRSDFRSHKVGREQLFLTLQETLHNLIRDSRGWLKSRLESQTAMSQKPIFNFLRRKQEQTPEESADVPASVMRTPEPSRSAPPRSVPPQPVSAPSEPSSDREKEALRRENATLKTKLTTMTAQLAKANADFEAKGKLLDDSLREIEHVERECNTLQEDKKKVMYESQVTQARLQGRIAQLEDALKNLAEEKRLLETKPQVPPKIAPAVAVAAVPESALPKMVSRTWENAAAPEKQTASAPPAQTLPKPAKPPEAQMNAPAPTAPVRKSLLASLPTQSTPPPAAKPLDAETMRQASSLLESVEATVKSLASVEASVQSLKGKMILPDLPPPPVEKERVLSPPEQSIPTSANALEEEMMRISTRWDNGVTSSKEPSPTETILLPKAIPVEEPAHAEAAAEANEIVMPLWEPKPAPSPPTGKSLQNEMLSLEEEMLRLSTS